MYIRFVFLCSQGRFTMAARYHNSIAEICEGELVDFELVSTVCSERSGWRNVMCGVVVWHVSRPAVIVTWWNLGGSTFAVCTPHTIVVATSNSLW